MVPAPLIGMGDEGRGQSQPDIINARPKNKACHKARPLFLPEAQELASSNLSV
jgi:hypothetical protein